MVTSATLLGAQRRGKVSIEVDESRLQEPLCGGLRLCSAAHQLGIRSSDVICVPM